MSSQDAAEPRPTLVDLDADLPSEEEVTPTARIGRYLVLDRLGAGGMGEVCVAYDPKLDRRVALKLVRSDRRSKRSSIGRTRLFREAQALAKLSHPNVVAVHDVDMVDGQVYISMEFVEGQTLGAWMNREKRHWKEVLAQLIPAGRGLQAAHEQGLVHRDFKPANVLLGDDGRVRVADFGLAKSDSTRDFDTDTHPVIEATDSIDGFGDDDLISEIRDQSGAQLTRVGKIVGTPAYMVAEQYLSLEVGPHTDQFSFFVTLFEALYGQLPFSGDTKERHIAMLMEPRIAEPKRRREVPNWLHKAIVRGLSPSPNDRFPDMGSALAAISRDPAKRWRRIGLGAAFTAAIGAGAFGTLVSGDEACQGAEDRLVDVWNPERSAELQAAFEATGVGYAADSASRAVAGIDDWTKAWSDQRTGICEATHVHREQSMELMDLRTTCLDRQLVEVRALVDVLVEADVDTVERAVDVVEAMPDPTTCADARPVVGHPEPEDPAELAKLKQVEQELAFMRALSVSGKSTKGAQVGAKLLPEAESLGHAPALAKVRLAYARALGNEDRADDAEAQLRLAITETAHERLSDHEAEAWLDLLFIIGFVGSKPADAKGFFLPAEAAVQRAGASERLENRLLIARASVYMKAGELELAEKQTREVIERLKAAGSRGETELANQYARLGTLLAQRGEADESIEILLESVERAEKQFGPHHPTVGLWASNLANAMQIAGRTEEGLVWAKRAVDNRERAQGLDHPKTGYSLVSYGVLARQNGDLDEAQKSFQRAEAIFKKHLPPDDPKLAVVANNLGRVAFTRKDYAVAEKRHDEARAIFVKRYGEVHPRIANTDAQRCDVFAAQELWSKAIAACQSAVDIRKATAGENAPRVALTMGDLANVQEKSGDLKAAEATRAAAQAIEDAGED